MARQLPRVGIRPVDDVEGRGPSIILEGTRGALKREEMRPMMRGMGDRGGT